MKRRLMALDIGRKRIGIAISDPLQMMARPLQTLQRRSIAADADLIAELARDWDIAGLIIGRPIHLDGSYASIIQIMKDLVEEIQEKTGLPVKWIDERLSSKEAEQLMAESGIKVSERRRRRDEFAAAVILRRYLEESV